MLEHAMQHFGMSARGYHRVLRVARTIADLELDHELRLPHIGEALVLRHLEEASRSPPVPRHAADVAATG
jgi:magnesium chelatase family protein